MSRRSRSCSPASRSVWGEALSPADLMFDRRRRRSGCRNEYVSHEHRSWPRDESGAPRARAERSDHKTRSTGADAGSRQPERDVAETGSGIRSLARYGRDSRISRAGKLDPVIGRDEEVRRVIQYCRAPPRTTRFIGEPVSARRDRRGLAPADNPEASARRTKNKKIFALDMGALRRAKIAAECEERLKAFLKEIADSREKIVCSSRADTSSARRATARWTPRRADAAARARRTAHDRRTTIRRVRSTSRRMGARASLPL